MVKLPLGTIPREALRDPRGAELSSYTPTLSERVTDWLAKKWYGDTREGVDRANRLVNVARSTIIGNIPFSAYDAGRAAASGRYGEAALNAAAVAAPLAMGKAGAQAAQKLAPKAVAPKVRNEVVVAGDSGLLGGRMPKSEQDITYGYRTMSREELDDAVASGFLKAHPKGNRFTTDDAKWFSGGDEQGIFGRRWRWNKDSVTVRVDKDKIPKKNAVRLEDLQLLNRESGTFVPLKDVLKAQRSKKKN